MRRTQIALRFSLCLFLVAGAPASVADGRTFPTAAKNMRAKPKRADLPARSRVGKREIKLKLFFTNPNHPDFANTCGAGEFVERRIPATKRLADASLRLLFAGPNTQEKAKGMESLSQLGRFYLGVSIKRGVAIVNFRPEAEEILQGTACEQEQILTPMHKTLTQWNTIKRVEYAINGKMIEEWDA